MKRFIIIIMATIAFAAQQPIMSQSHRATPRTTATATSDTAGIEAFSDTTGGTTGSVMPDTSLATNTYHHTYSVTMNPDDMDQAFGLLDTMFESMAGSMVFALLVLLIISLITNQSNVILGTNVLTSFMICAGAGTLGGMLA